MLTLCGDFRAPDRAEPRGTRLGTTVVMAVVLASLAAGAAGAQTVAGRGAAPSPAGRYITAVTLGENSCGAVTVQPLPTVVRHAPGDSVLVLTHGPLSYEAVLREDGSFAARPVSLPPDRGVATTITLAGRFRDGRMTATVRVDVSATPPCRYLVEWAGTREGGARAADTSARRPADPPVLDLTPPPPAAYAITGVSVVPMDRDRVLARHTVLVRDGRIAAVGPDGRVGIPAGVTRIDGRGRFLIPGLADMHVHLLERSELLAYAANGITTVRNLHGLGRHLAWRDSLARGELLGPRLFTSGPIVDGDPPTRRTNVVVTTAAQAESVVVAQKAAGYDFLKIYDNVPPDLYRVLAATAKRVGLPMVGHLPSPVGLEGFLEVRGQAGLEHVEELLPFFRDGRDTAGIGRLAAALAAARVRVTPTVTVHASALAQARGWAAVRARPAMRYMRPETARMWGWDQTGQANDGNAAARERFERTVGFFERALIPALHRAGVPLLAGTDAPIAAIIPGFALVEEIAMFRRAGLSPYEALRTATANPAEFLGRGGEFGVIAAGASADLVLLDASPLLDPATLARPRGVMLRGSWLPREWLDAALARLAASYGAPAAGP
jgi:imidazolonepropionase-like amidohydrolase